MTESKTIEDLINDPRVKKATLFRSGAMVEVQIEEKCTIN